MSLSAHELCQVLLLPTDASKHTIRARAARLATGKPEMGSSPAIRRALVEALRLAPVYTGRISAHGALTLSEAAERGVKFER